MAALSQLSYSPFEFKVIDKGNTRALPVAGRVQSEMQLLHPNRPPATADHMAIRSSSAARDPFTSTRSPERAMARSSVRACSGV
jgi:hypothetical protein